LFAYHVLLNLAIIDFMAIV